MMDGNGRFNGDVGVFVESVSIKRGVISFVAFGCLGDSFPDS